MSVINTDFSWSHSPAGKGCLVLVALLLASGCSYYDSPQGSDAPDYVNPQCGPPPGLVYPDHFWFVQISDLHQSRDNGSDAYGYAITPKGDYYSLLEQLSYIREVVRPAFVVATGDLVDGGMLGQQPTQWQDYRAAVNGACYDPREYHDLPGNHDAYCDPQFEHYLEWSISGALHHVWAVENDYGCFAFIALNTVLPERNDGALSQEEGDWLVGVLDEFESCALRLALAHHTIPTNSFDSLKRPEALAAGHVHSNMEWTRDGVLLLRTDAIYKPDGHMRIFSLDGLNLASAAKSITVGGPQVLISAPQDRAYTTTTNPQGHIVSGVSEVRALAFGAEPLELLLSVDNGAPLPMHALGGQRHAVQVDFSTLDPGQHSLEVWAAGYESEPNSRDRIEVLIP